jgi:hypothetical protein
VERLSVNSPANMNKSGAGVVVVGSLLYFSALIFLS